MDRYSTKDGVTLNDETRSQLLQMHSGPAKKFYINGDAAISRKAFRGRPWSTEPITKSPVEVDRPMRFDPDAVLRVIRVAVEIDFATSPISFRHAHGRGLLIERTLGSDVPDGECRDD